ncbi:hypothetical protein T310_10048 [Rasamsonia emersonii CBS 393.64]|uniref:Uncharacterized protein n=1 Tax=Rasamsonia emersonii (strain ATCC 16479 / CBS 393.64 / IMI 116815) TaxID=1408163 RepID=A0A0F4YDU3_RASE3|nr:hypothetical protein T310_10048 [Rasamsonia emersonii CBS 393.64]KKA16352.1 hypothetical protein T310_10048 [Rasamsonia emersonii CBS 393.64]
MASKGVSLRTRSFIPLEGLVAAFPRRQMLMRSIPPSNIKVNPDPDPKLSRLSVPEPGSAIPVEGRDSEVSGAINGSNIGSRSDVWTISAELFPSGKSRLATYPWLSHRDSAGSQIARSSRKDSNSILSMMSAVLLEKEAFFLPKGSIN